MKSYKIKIPKRMLKKILDKLKESGFGVNERIYKRRFGKYKVYALYLNSYTKLKVTYSPLSAEKFNFFEQHFAEEISYEQIMDGTIQKLLLIEALKE